MNITALSDNNSIPHHSALHQWAELCDQVGGKIGVSLLAAQESYHAMKCGGFENVTERTVKVPVGT